MVPRAHHPFHGEGVGHGTPDDQNDFSFRPVIGHPRLNSLVHLSPANEALSKHHL